jgi:hypothetical protein
LIVSAKSDYGSTAVGAMTGERRGPETNLTYIEDQETVVRFEVFTAVTMKNAVFWNVAPCRSCELNFYPEDGGDTFLRNVGSIHKIYTAPHPRRRHSSENCCSCL